MIDTNTTNKPKYFESLFRRNYKRLCFFAVRYVQDEEEAKDIVNDMFEYAWQHYDEISNEKMDVLLFQGVKCRCLNSLEHRIVKEKYNHYILNLYDEIADSPDEYASMLEQVDKACEELNEKTRFVLQRCYIDRKSYQEVADELSLSRESIKKYIIKALKILREKCKH